ncbi:MAG: hypothetical protein O7D34_03075 [Ignavibacteria bacterium]|nr:hypothetical protein [Ignavibacteria bacterium]
MIVAQLREVIEELVARRGAHVIDFVVRREGDTKVFEVFVDAEEAVTSDFCSALSRELRSVLEKAWDSRGSYRLTVSSPGMSRPLKFPWQYKKHVGRYLQVKARSGEGHQSATGKLVSFDDNGIELAIKEKNQHLRFTFGAIVEARLKAPW